MTATGHGDLSNEQGIANALAETGSDPKIATGHVESDPDGSGSGPKTAPDPARTPSESERDVTDSSQKIATARERTATDTSPSDDALDC